MLVSPRQNGLDSFKEVRIFQRVRGSLLVRCLAVGFCGSKKLGAFEKAPKRQKHVFSRVQPPWRAPYFPPPRLGALKGGPGMKGFGRRESPVLELSVNSSALILSSILAFYWLKSVEIG